MNSFANYIIETGLSLGVFTLVYWFILRKETRFKATRFYLLFALIFSTLLPILTIRIGTPQSFIQNFGQFRTNETSTNLLETVTVYASGIPSLVGNAILSFNYSVLLYQLGALAALFVIASGIFQLLLIATKNRVFNMKGSKLVVTSKEQSPYSFFNYIFIGRDLTEQNNWKTIVYHEIEHVKEGHSFDVLFVDFMMVFQWFNPFYWIIRRMVRENHEFLADTGVLNRGLITSARYKELLLSQAIGGHPVITSNFFNVKTIKKRFKMITNNNSNKSGLLRYSIGVLAALMLTMMFACEDIDRFVQKDSVDIFVYDGSIVDKSVVNNKDNYIHVSGVDFLDLANIYPELTDELKGKEGITVIFDSKDKEQMKKFNALQVKFTIDSNDVEGIEVMAYGTEKSANLDEQVFVIVEDMPEFPGGELALRKHIAQNVKYPSLAAENGIQGKVYVTFVVGSDGEVNSAKIARGVDPLLDAEALRVVTGLPTWKPGMQKGKAVAVTYTVPINFQLQ